MEYFFKNIWPILKKVFVEVFALIGIICSVDELLKLFYQPEEKFEQIIIFSILLLGFIIIIIKNIPPKKYSFFIKNKDIKIKLVIGDLLKQNASIIVPTNSTFDTKMENDFISLKSVQGQVQDKYFKNNINVLDVLIQEGLKNDKNYIKLKDRKGSKKNQYEIGTTVEVNYKDRRFYFLADSNINANGQTVDPNLTNITDALSRVWQFISECAHVETLAIPLLGTGRMGITNSREEILKQIIFSFVANNNTKKIAEELIICIRKEDIKKYKIDISTIIEYIDYVCKYQYDNYNI